MCQCQATKAEAEAAAPTPSTFEVIEEEEEDEEEVPAMTTGFTAILNCSRQTVFAELLAIDEPLPPPPPPEALKSAFSLLRQKN